MDFELLLVDDGSTDSSSTLCEQMARKDLRIRVFHIQKQGTAAARNVGLKNARGEYVLFLDSDDVWVESTVLSRFAERLQKSHADVLSYNFRKRKETGDDPPYFRCHSVLEETASKEAALRYLTANHLWIACVW